MPGVSATLRDPDTPPPHPYGATARNRLDHLATTGACLIAILFALGALGRAHQKLFWHDEIATVTLARLPTRALWQALRDGVDLHPPGFYLLTRAGHTIFGEGPIGTRVPSLAGVLLAALCVSIYVRRRHGPLAGLAAMLLLLGSEAHLYAYEARPYAVVLGLAGSALVCWQSATSVTPRRAWLIGLFVSLAAAMAVHYYAVLLLAPLAAGELARWCGSRRADWPLWIAAAASLATLVAWLPLMEAAREYSAGYFQEPSLRTVVECYASTMTELAVPFVISLVIAAGALVFLGSGEIERTHTHLSARHEWITPTALVMLPVLVYALAIAWTGAIVPRYALPWTIGFAILLPATIASSSTHRQIVLVALLGALFIWVGARQALTARWLAHQSPDIASAYPMLFQEAESDRDLPIVVRHPHVYSMVLHYAPPGLASRLVMLTAPGGVPEPSDTAIRGLRALGKWRPLRLEDFDGFLTRHRQFLVYGPTADSVLPWLRSAHTVVALRGVEPDRLRFATSSPGPYSMYHVTVEPRPERGTE